MPNVSNSAYVDLILIAYTQCQRWEVTFSFLPVIIRPTPTHDGTAYRNTHRRAFAVEWLSS